ncbi:MAG: hypothetical protein V4591_04350 [Bdellovibrionota bacterium]
MLNSQYSNLLHDKGFFLKVFPYYDFKGTPPSKIYYKSEAELRSQIDTIRKIRNRVFHHEKIHNYQSILDKAKAILKYLSEESFKAFF